MGNAIRHLKLRISTIPPDMPEAEAKELLEEVREAGEGSEGGRKAK